VPKACSVLLVRDRDALETAFTHDESYIPHTDREDAHPVDRTLEYSRPLSALKLWLAFRVHGASAIRAAIERNLRQARLLADLIRADPLLELLVEPQLSAVCFRHLPPPGASAVAHNAALAAEISAEGRILLAPATVDGIPCLRACIVNHRTGDDDVRAIVEVVRDVGARI
jgi:aromatic-L-amino-acid/L-tryptophan decarboxylase